MEDSIRANNGSRPGPASTWTQLSMSTGGEDRIYHIFFNGRMLINDLVIVRAIQPALECIGALRGDTATCTILEAVDSVEAWHFVGFDSVAGLIPIDTLLSSEYWSGRVAMSGLVTVDVFIDDSLHTFSDSLSVQARPLDTPPWRWDEDKWDYDPGGGLDCDVYVPYQFPGFNGLVAENTSTESCEIQTFTPRTNDVAVIDSTFRADSIFDGGPNHGLFFVDSAYYEMKHGSYFNPSVRPGAPGYLVTSADNLTKDCKAGKNVTSLSLNLHQFNLTCTKPPERRTFEAWWAAQEAHEGYGTPGHGPPNNGHQKQREIAAAMPQNNPYRIVEPLVGVSRDALEHAVQDLVYKADARIFNLAGNHSIVQGNWRRATYIAGKGWCGVFHAYWTDTIPAAYLQTQICGNN